MYMTYVYMHKIYSTQRINPQVLLVSLLKFLRTAVGQIYHLPYALIFFYSLEKAGKGDYSRLPLAHEKNVARRGIIKFWQNGFWLMKLLEQ